MGQRSVGWIRFPLGRTRGADAGADCDRLEQRQRSLTEASEKWHSLLREMELNGESARPQYERYYGAYIEARQVEKRADLELFNLRHGLVG